MSRIYEALQRASDRAVPDRSPVSAEPPTSPLERYTAEDPTHAPPASLAPHQPPARDFRIAEPPRRDPFGSPAPEFEGKLLSAGASGSAAAERSRGLATVLHQAQVDRGLKTILVTSAGAREGKTLTVVNLAVTLSESYARRVLIIDADLRGPSVHRVLDLPADVGLRDALGRRSGSLPLIEISPLVSVLPAGIPESNPLPRLSSDRMKSLIEECADRFDWVLIDTGPVGMGQEAHVLARFVQGVIFVIRAGAMPFTAVERSISELGRECIIGTVLNAAEASHRAPAIHS